MSKRTAVTAVVCAGASVALALGVIGMHGKTYEIDPIATPAAEVSDETRGDSTVPSQGGGHEDALRDADTDSDQVQGSGVKPSVPESPVDVPDGWVFVSIESEGVTTTWRYEASGSVQDEAARLLPLLEAGGMELVASDYLDLSGNAWGCVCKLPDDAGSLVVTLLPGASAREGGALEATIVMHEAPEWEEAGDE